MFECPDFFPIGPAGKWMFVTSKILQGRSWVTGGQHHWDEYFIGEFDGHSFTPEHQGVLDYGYVAAVSPRLLWKVAEASTAVCLRAGQDWRKCRERSDGTEGILWLEYAVVSAGCRRQ